MRITRLRVENFKSIGPAIELTDLGPMNVLHGLNNAGKSNILEALCMAAEVLARLPQHVNIDDQPESDLSDVLSIGNEIWAESLVHLPRGGQLVNRATAHRPSGGQVSYTLDLDVDANNRLSISYDGLADGYTRINHLVLGGAPVRLEELLHHEFLEHAWNIPASLVARPNLNVRLSDLAERLFLVKESQDPRDRDRWRALVEAVAGYAPELGGARLTTVTRVVKVRREGKTTRESRPGLAFEGIAPPHHIAPLEEQGQGIQAAVRVLGEIFLADADIICLEEPESHLSLSGQVRLRELLERVARDFNKQIFLTSHSFAFDCGEAFWRVSRDAEGFTQAERVHRTPELVQPEWGEKLEQTMRTLRDQQSPPLPAAWLSREGLVLLPEDVRERLHLDHLDILYFIPNPDTGRVELWTGDEIMAGQQERD